MRRSEKLNSQKRAEQRQRKWAQATHQENPIVAPGKVQNPTNMGGLSSMGLGHPFQIGLLFHRCAFGPFVLSVYIAE